MMDSLSNNELSDIQKEMKNTCDVFFQKLENAQLITDNPIKEFNPKSYLSWLNRDDSLIDNGKLAIIPHMKSIINKKFPEEDFIKFLIVLSIYQFTIRLEQLKDVFVDCLDIEKLKLKDRDSTLGDIIWKINDKLYPLKQISGHKQDEVKRHRKEHKNLFFIEFRNAIIHKKYVIGSTRITYFNENNEETKIYSKDFLKMFEQFNCLSQYIYEYKNYLEKSTE